MKALDIKSLFHLYFFSKKNFRNCDNDDSNLKNRHSRANEKRLERKKLVGRADSLTFPTVKIKKLKRKIEFCQFRPRKKT